MKKIKCLFMILVIALSTIASTQHGAVFASEARLDSSVATPRQVTQTTQQQPSQNKQTSIQRPTARTNWSKIKTLFE